jgi:hypothetical protein
MEDLLTEAGRPAKYKNLKELARAINEFDEIPAAKKQAEALIIQRCALLLKHKITKPEILKYSLTVPEKKVDPNKVKDQDFDTKDFAKEFDKMVGELVSEFEKKKGSVLISKIIDDIIVDMNTKYDMSINKQELSRMISGKSKYFTGQMPPFAVVNGEILDRKQFGYVRDKALEKLKHSQRLKDQFYND